MTTLLVLFLIQSQPQFLNPMDFLDPAESYLITHISFMGELHTFSPMFFPIEVSGIHIPFFVDFSVFSGSFLRRSKCVNTFSVFESDTNIPMTYLFSRRGANEYSHVGGLISLNFYKMGISLGGDFESRPGFWFGTLNKQNYVLISKFKTLFRPEILFLRAEKNTLQNKSLDIKRIRFNSKVFSTEFFYLTYNGTGIPGMSFTLHQNDYTAIKLKTLGKWFDNASVFYSRSSFPKFKVGIEYYSGKAYPILYFGIPFKGLVFGFFSKPRYLINTSPSPFLPDTQITHKYGLSGMINHKNLETSLELGRWKNVFYEYDGFFSNTKYAQLSLRIKSMIKLFRGTIGYSTYVFQPEGFGDSEIYSFSFLTFSVFRDEFARKGKIRVSPGLRAFLYENNRDYYLRVDFVVDVNLFDAVLAILKVYNLNNSTPPNSIYSPKNYNLLLSVVMPD